MLRHERPDLRFWACMALVPYDHELAEAVPATIKLIRIEGRGETAMEQSGTSDLLRRRFAVNYFWDVEAWERWWKAEGKRNSRG